MMSVLIGCLSSCSYIKPQHNDGGALCRYGCLSSCSYIKPQQSRDDFAFCRVVYHLVPTSNHNSTRFVKNPSKLFIILFLHQTTTIDGVQTFSRKVVYHLVPTSNHNIQKIQNTDTYVVYHLVPTSNHNQKIQKIQKIQLFIILFLHQTTTDTDTEDTEDSCLSSCSYIKPQQKIYRRRYTEVVYHLVPTSNHNHGRRQHQFCMLFIILFLHQTTTQKIYRIQIYRLFIILFLHQTTTRYRYTDIQKSCLSSCSYIKPQQDIYTEDTDNVVYHLVPTSNHNL